METGAAARSSLADRWLLLPKALYFVYFAGLAFASPFLGVYFVSQNIPKSKIGVLLAINPLSNLYASPLWSALADRTQRQCQLMMLCMFVSAAARFSLFAGRGFWELLALMLLTAGFNAGVLPLMDDRVLVLLAGTGGQYGRQRLWGSAAWGLFAPVAGFVIGHFGFGHGFALSSMLVVAALGVAWSSLAQLTRGSRTDANAANGFTFAKALLLLRAPSSLSFWAMIFVTGVDNAIVGNFVLLVLQDLGGSRLLLGLALTMTCVAEVPVMFVADRVIARLGITRTMLLVQLAFVVRFALYLLLDNPWSILPVETLHGITFGLNRIAIVTHAKTLAPPELSATAQGLTYMIHFGLGGVMGAIVGGLVFQHWGASVLFVCGALLSVVAMLLTLASAWRASAYVPDASASGSDFGGREMDALVSAPEGQSADVPESQPADVREGSL